MGENTARAPSRAWCNVPSLDGGKGQVQAGGNENGKGRTDMCNYLSQRNKFLSFLPAR